MAIQRAYFVVPGLLDQILSATNVMAFKLNFILVDGVNVLTNDFYSENPVITKDPSTNWELSNCDTSMTTCALPGTANSLNWFKAEWGIDFNDVNGVARGESIGTITGSNYGGFLEAGRIGVNQTPVNDRSGNSHNDAFFVDVDMAKSFLMDYSLLLQIDGGDTINYKFQITHDPLKCEGGYTLTAANFGSTAQDIIEYGWLSGSLVPGEEPLEPDCSIVPPCVPGLINFEGRFVNAYNVTNGGKDLEKIQPNGTTNANIWSLETWAHDEAFALDFVVPNATDSIYCGIELNTQTLNDITDMANAMHLDSGTIRHIQNGVDQGLAVAYANNDTIRLEYDGAGTHTWKKNGGVIHTINRVYNPGDILFFKYSADTTLAKIQDLTLDATNCCDRERTRSFALFVTLPEEEEPDRGLEECCYTNYVLADTGDNAEYKNDFRGVYHQRQEPNETVEFKLVDLVTLTEYDLNDSTYGEFKDFGDVANPNLSYYIVSWQKVLGLLGEGNYRIKKNITIAGIPITQETVSYVLRPFSFELADKTARIESEMDGLFVKTGVDFKGSDFRDMVRIRGYFGNREPEYTQDNIVFNNYSAEQVSMEGKNVYQLQSELLPECITTLIWDFHVYGNRIYITDYNRLNHDWRTIRVPVKLEGNQGTDYFNTIRDARINLTFSDRFENNIKRNC